MRRMLLAVTMLIWIWALPTISLSADPEMTVTENGIFRDGIPRAESVSEVQRFSPEEQDAAYQRLMEARQRSGYYDREVFSDDFEDGNMDGWQSGGGGFTTTVTDTTAGGYTLYSMEMIGGFYNHYTGQYYEFGAATPEYMSVWLSSGDETASDAYFVVGDSSTPSNNGIIFLYAKGTGYWNLYSGQAHLSPERYGAFLWYQHEFILDWNTREVDWYINGFLQYADVPFRSSSTTAVNRVYAHNYDDSIAWFDEYYFSESTAPTPTPALTPTPTPAVSPTITFEPCNHDGDVTLDGEITAGDAQLSFQIVLGMYTPIWEEACAADCNGDDEITAGDSQQIFETALMLSSCVDPMID